jgi:hypothetical protein
LPAKAEKAAAGSHNFPHAMKLRLKLPVKYWPHATSPLPRIADAGTEVILVRKVSETLFTVRPAHATDPVDTILVAASEVEFA